MHILLVLILIVFLPDTSYGALQCLDDPGDAAQIAAARADIEATCGCFDFERPGDYTRCSGGVVRDRVALSLLRSQCASTVRQIYARSICSRPPNRQKGPFVPCVTLSATGKVSCAVKPARRCGYFGTFGDRCWGSITCLDGADTNGDLRISGPGDTGSCTAGAFAFTDNGDGTIADASTGLQWEKKSDDGSLNDKDLCHPWAGLCSGDGETFCTRDADCALAGGTCDTADCQVPAPSGMTVFEWIDQLNATSFAGHNDWRLPTVSELSTLMRDIPGSPRIAPVFESSCSSGCSVSSCSCTTSSPLSSYHTSTSFSALDSWYVAFDLPDVGEGRKTDLYFSARAVRDAP